MAQSKGAPGAGSNPFQVKQPRVSATVELPSRGLFYGDKCPEGTVELYPMTGRDETLVTGMAAEDLPEVIDTILRGCLKTDVDPDEMLSTDKYFLVLALRANSYGEGYEFRARCPSCGFYQHATCKVPGDLEVLPFKGDDREPFSVKLPVTGQEVKFRLLRGKDEREVVRYRNREYERSGGRGVKGDPAHAYRVAKHVISVDGYEPENVGQAMSWYEALPALDASTLTDAFTQRTSGVNAEVGVTCTRCKFEFRTDLPLTAGFFRVQRERPGQDS